ATGGPASRRGTPRAVKPASSARRRRPLGGAGSNSGQPVEASRHRQRNQKKRGSRASAHRGKGRKPVIETGYSPTTAAFDPRLSTAVHTPVRERESVEEGKT